MDGFKERLNHDLSGRLSRNQEYKTVEVLLLYWEDVDDPGFKAEAQDLAELFTTELRYKVHHYPIPSKESQRSLKKTLLEFLIDYGKPDTLLIIHYGGHGDSNDDFSLDQRRQSVWAARRSGGSTLDWFKIQPELYDSEADVLLVLDCCYSAQAARSHAPTSHIELLAACAMGVQCPPPGPASFTTALIKAFNQSLTLRGHATVSGIHKALTSMNFKLLQTPIHVELQAGKRARSIRLEPLPASSSLIEQQAVTSLTFHVSLRSQINEEAFQGILRWLKSEVPREVSGLVVEDVCDSAGRLRKVMLKGQAFLLLDDHAKQEVVSLWTLFEGLLSGGSELVKASRTVGALYRNNTDRLANRFLEELESQGSNISRTVERDILTKLDVEKPISEVEAETINDLGLEDTIKLRRISLGDIHGVYGMESTPDLLAKQDHKSTEVRWETKELSGLGQVLIEYKIIEPHQQKILADCKARVEQLAALLREEKSASFQTLICLRWFYDEPYTRFGMVFKIPPVFEPQAQTLNEAIRDTRREMRPTLEERFRIAFKIGVAIRKWHLAGWVHQGISSHNILLYYRQGSPRLDYKTPYLCGFEYTRPSGALSDPKYIGSFELNIYRHLDRQTTGSGQSPSEAHRKAHDLYAYGVLLLELGLWELVPEFFNSKLRSNITSSKAQTILKQQAEQRLGHYMGSRYKSATIRCLDSDFEVEFDDRIESRLLKAFDELVLNSIDIAKALG